MNPAQTIYDWMMKLPVEHRHTVAFFTLTMLPGFPLNKAMDSERVIEHFKEWLLVDNDEEIKQHSVGRALFVKAVIDFNLADRASFSTWEKTAAFFAVAKAAAIADGLHGIAETASREKEQLALRKRQWKKTLAEWDDLCSGPLSKEALSSYLAP